MEALGYVIGVALCIGIYKFFAWWQNRPEYIEREKEKQLKQAMATQQLAKQQQNVMEQETGTRDLLMETLTKIGCQYEIDDEDDIVFHWQGGTFVASAANDCRFIIIYYYNWAEYELYDIDNISRVKRVINNANCLYNMNVVYTSNEAGNTFHVHTKKHFLFIEQIPEIDVYLRTVLGMFFEVRRYVETEIEKLMNEEEKVSR